ncbi:MAG: CPBP family intramembrane metalloprotease [Ruminococcus sp.]|nr:CPBP family intramembrane metalloprotease [Ruminococcus sp.]
MSDLTGITYSNEIIDVVEEFDYDTQCEQYNRYFKNWRKNKQNPYAFNFEMNKRESVYIESKGFKVPSIADAEAETIGNIMNIVGIAMLIWIFVDNILGKVIIEVLAYFGVNIHSNFLTSALSGGGPEIVTAIVSVSALKILIPAVYLKIKLKMPKEVRYMKMMNHPEELIRSLAMTLAVGTVTCLPSLYTNSTTQLYSYFMNLDADVSAWGQAEFIVYTVYDIIILSIIMGLFYNGAVFAALRQFGDMFAVGMTAVIAGLLAQDISELPAAVFITVIACCGMLRSGSIYTAFFVRIVYRMYMLAIAMIEVNMGDANFLDKNFFILSVFVVSALAVGLSQILIVKRTYYAEYSSEVPHNKRVRFAFRAYPFPAVALLCVLAMILKQVF